MKGRQMISTRFDVRPHARAGVEITLTGRLRVLWAFALMRGRELKSAGRGGLRRPLCSPSCEGGS